MPCSLRLQLLQLAADTIRATQVRPFFRIVLHSSQINTLHFMVTMGAVYPSGQLVRAGEFLSSLTAIAIEINLFPN